MINLSRLFNGVIHKISDDYSFGKRKYMLKMTSDRNSICWINVCCVPLIILLISLPAMLPVIVIMLTLVVVPPSTPLKSEGAFQ